MTSYKVGSVISGFADNNLPNGKCYRNESLRIIRSTGFIGYFLRNFSSENHRCNRRPEENQENRQDINQDGLTSDSDCSRDGCLAISASARSSPTGCGAAISLKAPY